MKIRRVLINDRFSCQEVELPCAIGDILSVQYVPHLGVCMWYKERPEFEGVCRRVLLIEDDLPIPEDAVYISTVVLMPQIYHVLIQDI